MSDASNESSVVEPRVAPVQPRVRVLPEMEVVRLEHQIARLLDDKKRPVVNVYGPEGSGKSVALAHLAAKFPGRLCLLDHVSEERALALERTLMVVFTSVKWCRGAGAAFEMAEWCEDDFIEYLLARHRDKCKSVMGRMAQVTCRAELGGLPELWAVVLEEMAADETLTNVPLALRRQVRRLTGERYIAAARFCYYQVAPPGDELVAPEVPDLPVNLLRHRIVGVQLGAETLAERLVAGQFKLLNRELPPDLLVETGKLLTPSTDCLRKLAGALESDPHRQANAVNVLLAGDAQWRPGKGQRLKMLRRVHAAGAQWKDVNLPGCDLTLADFSGADLTEANLGAAVATGATFVRAKLNGARMKGFSGEECDLSHADLTGADARKANFSDSRMEGANWSGAIMTGVRLSRAKLAQCRFVGAYMESVWLEHVAIEGADFNGADLRHARFVGVDFRAAELQLASFAAARLNGCRFENVGWPTAIFQGANVTGSDFTGSVMPKADFRGAVLRKAGLAEVEWEGADLRNADFTGCSFHMGSSRSGLVHSDIASEGTRTGFYTDDYNEQDYKPPEEIRKANLRGCDLRGAKVEKADFYLVDLREATYSRKQGLHFARCGAILRTRV